MVWRSFLFDSTDEEIARYYRLEFKYLGEYSKNFGITRRTRVSRILRDTIRTSLLIWLAEGNNEIHYARTRDLEFLSW